MFRLLDCGTDVSAAAYPLKHIDWAKVQRAADAKRKNLASSSLDYVVTWEGDQITSRGDGFAKVRYAGTGFLMMKRSALVRLCDAHPELKYRANHKSNDLNTGDLVRADLDRVSLFECMIDKTTGEYLSEDYAFCRRWIDLGGEILARPSKRAHAFRFVRLPRPLRRPVGLNKTAQAKRVQPEQGRPRLSARPPC
ncbi:hypothetical protein [Bradyrhizobium sp. USDA 4504]